MSYKKVSTTCEGFVKLVYQDLLGFSKCVQLDSQILLAVIAEKSLTKSDGMENSALLRAIFANGSLGLFPVRLPCTFMFYIPYS